MRWSVRSLALAQVVLVLAACSATAAAPSPAPSTAPTPSASVVVPSDAPPSPTPSPRATPTPVQTATAAPAAPTAAPDDSLLPYARVVANELRVRSEPSDQALVRQPSLPNGMLVVVVDGPVHASGYDWYQVQPTILEESARFYPFGWVAGADKDGEPWLEPAAVDCPPLPSSLREVATLNQGDEMMFELTCFGDEEVTFRARLATSSAICGLELPYSLEPRWMTGACSIDPRYLVHKDPKNTAELYTSWAPDVSVRGPDPSTPRDQLPVVEVTGQYDHPAAQDCRAVVPSGTPSADLPDPNSIVLNCRRQFVITAVREVGS